MRPPNIEKNRAAALGRRRVVPAIEQRNRIGDIACRVCRLYGSDQVILDAIGEEHSITVLLPDDVLETKLFVASDELQCKLAAEREVRRLEIWIGILEVDAVFDICKVRRIVFVVQVSARRV